MQESERQTQFDNSPSSSSMKQQQMQMTSQSNMQNYDSLLYSEITENNETLLNTPQHPLKQKNPLLKNTQQNDSGQASERQQIQQSGNSNANAFNNQANTSNRSMSLQQQQSSNDKKQQNQMNAHSLNQNEQNKNTTLQQQQQQTNKQKGSPEKINEFQVYTEEDEQQEESKQVIERMDMSGNMLQKIQKLDNFMQLVYLNLSYNRISVIENIDILVGLQYLNLSNNIIREIPVIINKNTQLQHLLLSSNNISSIDSLSNLQQLYHLKELNLLDNPIQQSAEYKSFIKNNLKQILLLDQRNIHISNLNSVGESWNSQLSFSNNPISVTQSAHFLKKNNNKQGQNSQQQNLFVAQPIQGLVESFANQQLQNRQNHIYSFGSQSNDTPSNQLFGFELSVENQLKMKKPHSLDMQYLTMQNGQQMQYQQQQQQNTYYFNNMDDLNKSITEIETDLDSDGNVLDKQFQEQRMYFSNTKSAKKNFQAFLEYQKQIQLQQQFQASPQANEGSIVMFENSNNNENHMKSVWQNPIDTIDQTFSESANKNSFLQESKLSPKKLNVNMIQVDNIQTSETKKNKSQEEFLKKNSVQSNIDNVVLQKSDDQNPQQNQNFRRNLRFDEQVSDNFLPNLSEEEAYRLKKCLFQQNNDKIEMLNKKQFQQGQKKQNEEINNINTNNTNTLHNLNEGNHNLEDEIDLTNLHSISNYVYDESTSKKQNQNNIQKQQLIQLQNEQQQFNIINQQPPPLPARDDLMQFGKDKQKVSPFLDLNGISNSDNKTIEQSANHLNNVSQLQSLFDNIESHRGDFLLTDFTQIYQSKIGGIDSQNIQMTPSNNIDGQLLSPTEESTISQNIFNSEKQCQSVANTLHVLAEQFKSLHESFQDYKQRLDETADKSYQLVQKIVKCTEDSQKESIKEKEKLIKDIQQFKNDIDSSFEQSNIFIAEFGLQISKFMKEIQGNNENREFAINDGLAPKIPIGTLKSVKNLFEKIQNFSNQLFVIANRMTEDISRSKSIQKDFLVEKLNQNVENIITLFKEISNLHLTCCDTFESIEHTSERLTKFFIHIIRLMQAKQAIQYSSHKRNPSNQTNVSSNQTLQSKPISAINLSKDISNSSHLNSRLNRQQSSKDFNLQSLQNTSVQQQINNMNQQQFIQQQQPNLSQQNNIQQQYNNFIQQQNQNLINQQNQLIKYQENQDDAKTPKNIINSNQTLITPQYDELNEEDQKKLLSSNIEQIQMQMMNYRKEIQHQHFKNQKSEELRVEELDLTQRMNLLQQNINNISIQPRLQQQQQLLLQQQLLQQQSNTSTPIITPNSDIQIKSNIPISPNSPHLTINSPNAQINQLKSNPQSTLLRSSKHQQDLEVLKFKFSDFEKTSLQRYDSLLKTKEQVEKDYSQIVQNYSELQTNYENILQKYSSLQSKYEEQLIQREKDNHEIEREELISQISHLKLRVSDLEKHVSSSENQKQLLLKDKQILKEQISLVQKDYQTLEKQNIYNSQQNQKLIENNKELNQQNLQLRQELSEAENTILNMKQVLTPRLPNQQYDQLDQGGLLYEQQNQQEKQYSHKKSLSQQISTQHQPQITQINKMNQTEELNQVLKNILQNVNTNLQQNNQIISMLSTKEIKSNNTLQIDNLNENNINESHAQEEAHQEWSEMLKMQIKQKQILYKQIQAITTLITSIQLDDDINLKECIKKITSLQETTTQQTQTDPFSLANTQYQFFDSIISPPSKTSTVITQQTNQNHNINTQTNLNNNNVNTNTHLEDSNTKSNLMTATTMTLPNILESVRKHQHHLMQTKLKNNTTGNSSSSASEKLYKLAAQRCEEETAKCLKTVQPQNQQYDKWFNNSPDRYCGQQNNLLNEEKSEEGNQSSSQHSSSTQNKSLQKSRQILKQMTDQAKDKKQFLNEDSAFLQTKKKTSNDMKQIDQNTSSGSKKNLNKTHSDLHNQMERKTFRNTSNGNQSNTSHQQDFHLNHTMPHEKPKRDTTKSPPSNIQNKVHQQNIMNNNQHQPLMNNFLKKDFKYPTKTSQTNLSNQSNHQTNKTQQSQNQSASVINPTQLNSNNNNPNNTSTLSHYKSNSNISDKAQQEHAKKQKNCLKSVINAYKNIQTLRKMQDILKSDENLTSFLNKTATHIPTNQSFSNNPNHTIQNITQTQQQLQPSNVSNTPNSVNSNQLNKIQKKVTRSQSNLSTQNAQKTQNPININLFSQLMNINYSVSSARQKSANFKSTRNINESSSEFNAINLYNSAKQQSNSGQKVAKKKKKQSSQVKVQIKQNTNDSNINTSNFFNNHNNTTNANNITNDLINNSHIQNTSNLNNTVTTFSNVNNSNAHITPSHTKSVSSILASIYQHPAQNQNILQQQDYQNKQQEPTNRQSNQQLLQNNDNSPYLVQDILTANQQLANQPVSKSQSISSVVILPSQKNRSLNSAAETSSSVNQTLKPVYINNHSIEFPNKKKTSFKSHLEDQKINEQLQQQIKKVTLNSSQDSLKVQRNNYQ